MPQPSQRTYTFCSRFSRSPATFALLITGLRFATFKFISFKEATGSLLIKVFCRTQAIFLGFTETLKPILNLQVFPIFCHAVLLFTASSAQYQFSFGHSSLALIKLYYHIRSL